MYRPGNRGSSRGYNGMGPSAHYGGTENRSQSSIASGPGNQPHGGQAFLNTTSGPPQPSRLPQPYSSLLGPSLSHMNLQRTELPMALLQTFETARQSPAGPIGGVGAPGGAKNMGYQRPQFASSQLLLTSQTVDPMKVMAQDPIKGRKYVADKLVHDVYSKLSMVEGKRVVETYYLTHALIKEFSHSPLAPPAPGVLPGAVKSRVLVICARQSLGRIMIQKGKFNEQKGVYQIGRTWDMDELNRIKRVLNDEVVLTLNKDYYWKMSEGGDRTTRFIKALALYYGLYEGKYPSLEGISEMELRLPRVPVKMPIGDGQVATRPGVPELVQKLAQAQAPVTEFVKPPIPIKSTSLGSPRQPPLQSSQQRHPYAPPIIEGKSAGPPSMVSIGDDESAFNFGTQPSLPQDLMVDVKEEAFSHRRTGLHQLHHLYHLIGLQGRQLPIKTRLDELRRQLTQLPENKEIEEFGSHIPIRSPLAQSQPNLNEDITDDEDDQEDQRGQALGQLEGLRQPPTPLLFIAPPGHPGHINTDALDTSIQEIENLLDLQFAFDENGDEQKSSPKRTPNMTNLAFMDLSAYDDTITSEFPKTPGSPNLYADQLDEPATPSLHVRKGPRDAEIEELLEEISWGITDTLSDLLKKLSVELQTVKQKNVSELLLFDIFSDTLVSKEVTTATGEVTHLTTIFKRMELDFKLLLPQVNEIELQLKGLQLRFANQQTLHTTLKDILETVNVNQADLVEIANFVKFDLWKTSLPQLETKLQRLYSAVQTVQEGGGDGKEVQMMALKEYESHYDEVIERFSKNFVGYTTHKMNGIFADFKQNPHLNSNNSEISLVNRLAVELLVFSTVSYFCKLLAAIHIYEINQYFNKEIAKILERNLMRTMSDVYSRKTPVGTPAAALLAASSPLSLPTSLVVSHDTSFGKSRALRMLRKEKLRTKLSLRYERQIPTILRLPTMENMETPAPAPAPHTAEFLKAKTGQIDDPLVITKLIDEARDVICVTQYFVGSFFHYTNLAESLDFSQYLEENPYESRRKFVDKAANGIADLESIQTASYDTRDVIANMTAIFGNYINTFIKMVNPIDYRIPQILVHLEFSQQELAAKANSEFVMYNFYKRVIDKLSAVWKKFFLHHIELVTQAQFVALDSVLPSIRTINELVMATERLVANLKHLGDTLVREMIDKMYDQATDAIVHLFLREDPLLKQLEFDDQERHQRLVVVLRNAFYLIDSFKQLSGQVTNKMLARLDQVFNTARQRYFAVYINQLFGKLLEFVLAHEKNGKQTKYNKKMVKSLLAQYTHRHLTERVLHIHRELVASFMVDKDHFERDLVVRLWQDLENEFVNVFSRLALVMRQNYGDVEWQLMPKHEIHLVFREAQMKRGEI